MNARHDLLTPLNLIIGFCEALLKPTTGAPLPAPYRADVEAIYRNAQQLAAAIDLALYPQPFPPQTGERESHAVGANPRVRPVGGERPLIVLDDAGSIFELVSQYVRGFSVIRVASVEALGRLSPEIDPLAVVTGADGDALVPLIAQLTNNQIPILTLNFLAPGAPVECLTKPVQFDQLEAILQHLSSPPRLVLVIDDNRDSLELLSRMLASLPQPPLVAKAYSGREGMALVGEQTPDLILMDYVLPDMDGMAVCDFLRLDARLSRIPVVFVSAHRPPEILMRRGASKTIVFQMTAISPVALARQIEAILSAFG